jgi:hypothetical protein
MFMLTKSEVDRFKLFFSSTEMNQDRRDNIRKGMAAYWAWRKKTYPKGTPYKRGAYAEYVCKKKYG